MYEYPYYTDMLIARELVQSCGISVLLLDIPLASEILLCGAVRCVALRLQTRDVLRCSDQVTRALAHH